MFFFLFLLLFYNEKSLKRQTYIKDVTEIVTVIIAYTIELIMSN